MPPKRVAAKKEELEESESSTGQTLGPLNPAVNTPSPAIFAGFPSAPSTPKSVDKERQEKESAARLSAFRQQLAEKARLEAEEAEAKFLEEERLRMLESQGEGDSQLAQFEGAFEQKLKDQADKIELLQADQAAIRADQVGMRADMSDMMAMLKTMSKQLEGRKEPPAKAGGVQQPVIKEEQDDISPSPAAPLQPDKPPVPSAFREEDSEEDPLARFSGSGTRRSRRNEPGGLRQVKDPEGQEIQDAKSRPEPLVYASVRRPTPQVAMSRLEFDSKETSPEKFGKEEKKKQVPVLQKELKCSTLRTATDIQAISGRRGASTMPSGAAASPPAVLFPHKARPSDDPLWRRNRSKVPGPKGVSQLSVLGQLFKPVEVEQAHQPALPAHDRCFEGFSHDHLPGQVVEVQQYTQAGEVAAGKVNLHSEESRRLQGDKNLEGSTCRPDFCFLASSEPPQTSGVHTVHAERSGSIQLSDNDRQFLPNAQLSVHSGCGAAPDTCPASGDSCLLTQGLPVEEARAMEREPFAGENCSPAKAVSCHSGETHVFTPGGTHSVNPGQRVLLTWNSFTPGCSRQSVVPTDSSVEEGSLQEVS